MTVAVIQGVAVDNEPSDLLDAVLTRHIHDLESRLLMGPDRFDPQFLDRVLRSDFTESDARGRMTNRADVIAWLLTPDGNTVWSLHDFSLQRASEGVVISHFRVRKTTNHGSSDTVHSGVWCRQSGSNQNRPEVEGLWQLVFHQGTYLLSKQ